MAENETSEAQETTENGGSGARTAVKAAAAAAVTGAAAMAARKALSSSNGKSGGGGSSPAKGRGSSTLTQIASGGWDAARDAVVPLAEDAAGAAGTWLAKNGPEIVRDKIVPRFITSFNEAKGD